MRIADQLIDIWKKIERKCLPAVIWDNDPYILWKERAVFSIYLAMVVFGFIAVIPSLVMAYRLNLWLIFVSDIILYSAILAAFFSTALPLKLKTWTALLLFYLLGTMLLFAIGFYGAGYIWLFVATLIAGIILDGKSVAVSLILNLLCMVGLGLYIRYGVPDWVRTVPNPMVVWLVITANFMTVNMLTAVFILGIKSSIEDAFEKQVEAQTRSFEENLFFQNMIDSMPGLFFLFRRKGDNGLLKRWNKNLELTLGFTANELKDQELTAFFKSANRHFILDKRKQFATNGKAVFESEVLKKNGDLIPLHIEVFSFKKDKKAYFIGSAIDISQRLAGEKEKADMLKRLAAAQKNGALGTLASGIAHDFNNILSGIQGFAELIRIAPDEVETVQKGVDQILGGSRRAGELVRQILTFNRQVENEKQPMKLYLIVKEAVKFLRSSIPATIEIRENIASKDSIFADGTQMHQVVINLCTNAYHAMRKTGGRLSVSLERVRIRGEQEMNGLDVKPGDCLMLMVADTGHGMNEETAGRIFEPYFTTKKSGEGTGLGLAVVSGIVQDHGGDITVDSKEGIGTTFRVYLPVWKKKAVEVSVSEPAETETVYTGNSEKVMVVDDEIGIRMSVKALLEDHGYEAEIYPDGRDALKRFRENPAGFDLVITDITMPRMAGNLLAEELLKIRSELPVIMFTGYSDFTDTMAHQMGVKAYLQKPVDGRRLLRLIRELL